MWGREIYWTNSLCLLSHKYPWQKFKSISLTWQLCINLQGRLRFQCRQKKTEFKTRLRHTRCCYAYENLMKRHFSNFSQKHSKPDTWKVSDYKTMEPIAYNIEEIKSLLSLTNSKKREKPLQTDDCVSYLASSMCDWTEEQQSEALLSVYNKKISSPYYKLLVDIYQADKHIEITQSHQVYIMKTFNRLKVYFPTVKEFQLKKHDQSKYSFKQVIGYTKKFVHSCPWEDEIWQDALHDHYYKEDHHPEHYKNGNMPRDYLEESVIDMIACHWERDLYGINNTNNNELANISEIFLNRYTVDDKKEVIEILKNIQMDNNSN